MSGPKLFEKEDPKEELRGDAIIVTLIGIMVLAEWVLYNVRSPFIALFAIIGNVLENIFRSVSDNTSNFSLDFISFSSLIV